MVLVYNTSKEASKYDHKKEIENWEMESKEQASLLLIALATLMFECVQYVFFLF